jgi:hypothetical protein
MTVRDQRLTLAGIASGVCPRRCVAWEIIASRPNGSARLAGPSQLGKEGASTPRSSLRELMPSLVKTLPRWYSMVRGLRNS